jgi:hypothetical protein
MAKTVFTTGQTLTATHANSFAQEANLVAIDTVNAASGALAGSVIVATQTWNTTGNPTAIKLNVTNTASGTTSKLMDLQVDGGSKLVVDRLGQVGIGQPAPAAKLDVNGTTDMYGTLTMKSGNQILWRTTSGDYDFEAKVIGNGSNAKMSFGSSAFASTAIVYDISGRVGIGTSTPTAKLQIVGLVEYADNASAATAGLTVGAMYRTGDLLKIVH